MLSGDERVDRLNNAILQEKRAGGRVARRGRFEAVLHYGWLRVKHRVLYQVDEYGNVTRREV